MIEEASTFAGLIDGVHGTWLKLLRWFLHLLSNTDGLRRECRISNVWSTAQIRRDVWLSLNGTKRKINNYWFVGILQPDKFKLNDLPWDQWHLPSACLPTTNSSSCAARLAYHRPWLKASQWINNRILFICAQAFVFARIENNGIDNENINFNSSNVCVLLWLTK